MDSGYVVKKMEDIQNIFQNQKVLILVLYTKLPDKMQETHLNLSFRQKKSRAFKMLKYVPCNIWVILYTKRIFFCSLKIEQHFCIFIYKVLACKKKKSKL